MALSINSVHKPFRKLEKLLKNFPDPPSAEDVHDVRTQTRRIEAIAGAFRLDSKKTGKTLLKDLKPIRKAAGDVRDMDVLTDFVASLHPRGDADCRVQLMEHLARQRGKAAVKLAKKANANAKRTRTELKRCDKIAESGIEAANSRDAGEKDLQKNRRKSAESMASSLQIEQELSEWPKLNESNIHAFRLKVKQLRYVFELAENGDSQLIEALGSVKDQIGLWHDWNELSGIAAKMLDHGAACPIRHQIQARTKQELEKALAVANRLRAEYLTNQPDNHSRKRGVVKEMHPAMIKAASRLAS
jgi:CHAD domain-containing protein